MIDFKEIYKSAIKSVSSEKIKASVESFEGADSEKDAIVAAEYTAELCMRMIGEYHIQLAVELAKQGIKI